MSKLIVFWEYDTFPYCLWGEVMKLDSQYFTVKGYDGIKFKSDCKIVVMTEHAAAGFISLFEELKANKRRIDDEYHNQAISLLKDLRDVDDC